MDFKTWLERKFLEPNSAVDADIERFAAKLPQLNNYLSTQSKTTNILDEPDYLGSIWAGSRRISVYAGKVAGDGGYNPRNDCIVLNRDILNNPQMVKQILRHELTHAKDPKSQRIKQSSKYLQAIDNLSSGGLPGDAYFQDPKEFDAYGANIAKNIRDELLALNPEKRKYAIVKVKDWLRTGDSSDLDLSSLPSLAAWKKDARLWRMFRQRLYTLVSAV